MQRDKQMEILLWKTKECVHCLLLLCVNETLPSLQMSWYLAFLGSPKERRLGCVGYCSVHPLQTCLEVRLYCSGCTYVFYKTLTVDLLYHQPHEKHPKKLFALFFSSFPVSVQHKWEKAVLSCVLPILHFIITFHVFLLLLNLCKNMRVWNGSW